MTRALSTTIAALILIAFAVVGHAQEGGTLTVQENYATPDHFWCHGDPDPDNEMASIEGLVGPEESISWDSVTLRASGSGDDLLDISSVNIWEDVDNDGKVSASDILLGTGTYPADNGMVSIAFAPAPIIPASGSLELVISHTMSGSSPVGATYSLDVIGASGTGQTSGVLTAVTLNPDPLPGATMTVSPQLTVQENHATPDHFWCQGDPDPDNEMASIEGVAGPAETISWDSIMLQASGTGDDSLDISSVKVWADNDDNGKVSAPDSVLGAGAYPADNGAVSIALASPPIMPPGGSLLLVISYTMSASAPVGATYSLDVIGAAGSGQTSGMPVIVTLNPYPLPGATKIVGPEPLTIGQAKTLSPVGAYTVLLQGKVQTADFTGELNLFYIEELVRSAGIGVYPLGPIPAIQPNDLISVMGTTMLLDGTELVVTPERVIVGGNLATELPAVCMGNRDTGGDVFGCQPAVLGASGLNNIGLLITTWGTVTQIGPDYLYVDDGSNLRDDTLTGAEENVGVRVICDPSGYAPGDYLIVTGISSCFEASPGLIARRILTRGPQDARQVTGP